MLARGYEKGSAVKDVAFLRGIVSPGAAKPWATQSLTPSDFQHKKRFSASVLCSSACYVFTATMVSKIPNVTRFFSSLALLSARVLVIGRGSVWAVSDGSH
jgi:hypothetical protein